MSGPKELRKQIVILSGGMGGTAQQVVTAALAQFPGVDVEVIRATGIRKPDLALNEVRKAAENGAVICHSLVDPLIRTTVEQEARRLGVASVDVLGPALTLLGDYFEVTAEGRPGLLYAAHQEQIDRMDAVDYTLAHDDGIRLDDLGKADVVLVGASRTSKSVTCFYLASHGVRAANVPLIHLHHPPRELTRLRPRRVIGLMVNAQRLQVIRQTRMQKISETPIPGYSEPGEIREELRWIRNVMAENRWECIDVSYKATEEVAAQIIDMIPPPRRRKGQKRVVRW